MSQSVATNSRIDVGDLVRAWRDSRESGEANAALEEAWEEVRKGLDRVPSFTIHAGSSPRTLTVHRAGGGEILLRIADDGLSLLSRRGAPSVIWIEDLGAHAALAAAELPDITGVDHARGAELVAFADAYLAHLEGRGDEPVWSRGVRGDSRLDPEDPFDRAVRAHVLLSELTEYAPDHPLLIRLWPPPTAATDEEASS